MKIHVISDLPYHSKLNLSCGNAIHPLSYYTKRPQPLTSMFTIDLNPEGNCDSTDFFVLNVWKSLDDTGDPDSYIIMDKDGGIKEKKEGSILFDNWKPFEPEVFQVTLVQKKQSRLLLYIILSILFVFLLLFGIFLFFYITKKIKSIPTLSTDLIKDTNTLLDNDTPLNIPNESRKSFFE